MWHTVWVTGGCTSWYLDGAGRNLALWPDFTWAFAWQTRRFDPASSEVWLLTHSNTSGPWAATGGRRGFLRHSRRSAIFSGSCRVTAAWPPAALA